MGGSAGGSLSLLGKPKRRADCSAPHTPRPRGDRTGTSSRLVIEVDARIFVREDHVVCEGVHQALRALQS